MVRYIDQTIINEQLRICGYYDTFIRTVVKDSEITLEGAGGRIFDEAWFEGCVIKGKRIKGYFLDSASFRNCTFLGQFIDCAFGIGGSAHEHKVANCDFSKCSLHYSDFRGGLDYESCVWPSWPTVIFRVTFDNRGDMAEAPLPAFLSSTILGRPSRDHHVDYRAMDLSKCDCDPSEVLAVIYDHKDALIYNRDSLSRPDPKEVARCAAKFRAQQARKELHSWWHHVTQQISITSIVVHSDHVDVNVNKSDRSYIPGPTHFTVRLTGNLSCSLIQGGNAEPISIFTRRYRLMGAQDVSDYHFIHLKGHRKELGIIRLGYTEMNFFDLAGQPIDKPVYIPQEGPASQ